MYFVGCIFRPWHGNEDNACTPVISAGINRPPPSRPSRIYPECQAYKTRNTLSDKGFLSRTRDPARECLFIYDGEVGLRIRSTGEGEVSSLRGKQE